MKKKISNVRLAIGIPLTFPFVYSGFFDSFIAMEKPDQFLYFRESNGPIEKLRNNLVRNAKHNNCTHIIMMDVDQLYHPLTIPRLLSHKQPVVGALVHRRYPPFDPLMLKGRVNEYETIDKFNDGDLVEVDATGTGCLLIDLRVFDAIPEPWFEFVDNPSGIGIVGEDIWFCTKLKQAGYKIFVDTSVPAGHLSTLSVTGETYQLYKNMKHMQKKGIDLSKISVDQPEEGEK